jgi:hypothetical protein
VLALTSSGLYAGTLANFRLLTGAEVWFVLEPPNPALLVVRLPGPGRNRSVVAERTEPAWDEPAWDERYLFGSVMVSHGLAGGIPDPSRVDR